jgi:hypothetical protein
MILNSPNLEDQDNHESQPCLTIAQTIYFNIKKKNLVNAVYTRHTLEREPPLPLYKAIRIHASTRSKNIVQNLYRLGTSVSYKRVMEVEEGLAVSVCNRFREDGVVAPVHLRKGLFTVGAQDNLDHNPSSTTAQSSFHGTGISLLQFPTKRNPGELRPSIAFPSNGTQNHSLPDDYATVPAVALKTSDVAVPVCHIEPYNSCLNEAKKLEESWLKSSLDLLGKDLDESDKIVWAAYHATHQAEIEDPPAITALLPLFYEKAATLL